MESENGGYKREFEQVLKMSNILQNKQKRDIVFHNDIAKFNAISSNGATLLQFFHLVSPETKEKWKIELSVKSNEELATQSEAQYLAVKRKLDELNKK